MHAIMQGEFVQLDIVDLDIAFFDGVDVGGGLFADHFDLVAGEDGAKLPDRFDQIDDVMGFGV